MREILFRGKLKNTDEWAFGNLNITIKGTNIITPDDTPIGKYGAVIPETVGQYTGLTDKNGKKIFEGDICRNIKTGEVVWVDWHGTFAGFVWSRRKENSHLCDFGELFRCFDNYEVIGNIHDNPELIGGGD